jgi:hypothetical protein
MKQAPDRANDHGTRGQQMYLLEPPPFSPTYPNRSSLAGEALAMLLNGQSITHPDFLNSTASWRLSEPIRQLRRDHGWPVETNEIAVPTADRPTRHIAAYFLPQWVLEAVGAAHG